MSIKILVEVKVKPEYVNTLPALLAQVLPDTRAFAGCEQLTIHVNQDDPQNFVFIEEWANRDAYERYLAWRTENGTLAQLFELVDAPPTFRFFDSVPV